MTRRSNLSKAAVGFSAMRTGALVVGLILPSAFALIGCGTNQLDGIDPTGGPSFGDGGVVIGPDGDPLASCAVAPSSGAADRGAAGVTVPAPGGVMGLSAPVFNGVTAIEPPPPISGGTLIVLRDGVTAVAADADRDRIYVVDLTDMTKMTVRASIPLNLRDQPGRLVQDGAGLVHVVLRGSAALVTVDPVAGQVTMRRSVCALPRGLAYDKAQDRLHVACAGGELLTFVPTGATATRTLKLQPDLRDVVVDGARLMVSRFRSAEVMVLDANGTMTELVRPPSFTNTSVHGGSPFGPSVAWRTMGSPEGGAVMVHHRGMNGQVGRMPGGYGGFSPCDPIVHTSVTRVKSGERPVAGPAMPGFVLPVDLALSADGKRIAMVAAGNGHAQFGARKLFVADVADVTAEWEGGCGMDDKHGPSPTPTCGGGAGGSAGGMKVPPSPDGTCPAGLLLCNGACFDPASSPCGSVRPLPGDGSVGVADAGVADAGVADGGVADSGSTGTSTPPSMGTAGATADPAARPVVVDGGVAPGCAVDLPAVAEPVSVAFAGPGRVLVQTREPAQLWVVSEVDGSTNTVALSQESRADTGHAVFHSNSGGGLACASCHPEGHEDGRVWNFQCEGPRRTQDLAGGLSGTEPFHWGGDLGDFPILVNEVFVGRMSGPSLTRDETAATLRWINSVPAKPGLRQSTDPAALRGRLLFEDKTIACSSCHNGSALTNNMTVDVGTSAKFQVPTLRGLGWRGPYMHDGCAPTLAARFGNKFCDGGDAHGKTSQLTPAQIDDLVAYMESL